LQDALNMTLEQIIYFHDYLIIVILVIISMVGYLIVFASTGKGYSSSIVANHVVESLWTILPIVVLIFLVYPSIYLLYLIDENSTDFLCTLKVVGHQRYWVYELDMIDNLEVDSYTNLDRVIRLLDVDNRVMVPSQELIRALITSNDVLHP
jgi:heme/copper-type cytochrome/quinol oxidase subunit 2